MGDFLHYLNFRKGHLFDLTVDHAQIVGYAIGIATAIALVTAILVYRRERTAAVVVSIAGTFLTIPSLALFGLLIPIVGLGTKPTLVALVLYALLPILRNAVVGLRGVDPAVIESAQGMGMGRLRRLVKIEVPLAWPVILTGIRVSTVMIVGIAAVGAYVNGPGLGQDIFAGLSRIGTPTALHLTLSAIFAIALLALVLDALYLALGKLTTSKGIR